MLRAASQSLRKIGSYSKETLAAICNTRDLNVVQNGPITELHLRRDWNGNTLTQKTINDLRVSLQLMEEDIHSKGIMIKSNGEYFSRGADYLYLGHLGLNKQSGAEEYFAALYDLVYFIGRMETPLIPLINGKALGAAACLTNLATFAIATPNTSMAFQETAFGFIPTGGASYHLSRLAGEVGLYLALTGKMINGSDAVHLKFAYNYAHLTDEFLADLGSTAGHISMPIPSDKLFGDYYNEFRKDKDHVDDQEEYENWLELTNRVGLSDVYKDRRENVKMVYADLMHRNSMRNDSWSEVPGHDWRSHISPGAQNHLRNFENTVMDKKIWSNKKFFSLFDDLKAIYRCFTANTLEEAIGRIEKELEVGNKEWARDTLSRLSTRSPLALEATYRLLKEAKKLEWAQCLDLEFNVALKLAKQPDFHEASVKILSRHPGVPEWKVNFPVPKDLIEDLFTAEKTLDLEGVKPNQFVPVKEWYKTFASGPRLYLNETSTDHYYARMSFNEDVKSFLHDHDLDVRDPCVEASEVRKGFWNAEMFKRKMDEELDKVQRMAEDPLLKEFYISDRKKAIDEMFKNEAEISKRINDLITKRFEKKFEDRINTIFDRSRNARSLEKQEFFRGVKDFVHRKHFLESEGNLETLQRDVEDRMKAENLPMTIPFDTSKNYIDGLQKRIVDNDERNPNIIKYDDLFSIDDYKSYFATYHPAFLEKNISKEIDEAGKGIWKKFKESTDPLFLGNPGDLHKIEKDKDTQRMQKAVHNEVLEEEFKDLVPEHVLDSTGLYDSDEGVYNYDENGLNKAIDGVLNEKETEKKEIRSSEEQDVEKNANKPIVSEDDADDIELAKLTSELKAFKKEKLGWNENEASKLYEEIIAQECTSEGQPKQKMFEEFEAAFAKAQKEETDFEGKKSSERIKEEEEEEVIESDSEWGISHEFPKDNNELLISEAFEDFEKITKGRATDDTKILDYLEAIAEGKDAKIEEYFPGLPKVIVEVETGDIHRERSGKPRKARKISDEASNSEEEFEAKSDEKSQVEIVEKEAENENSQKEIQREMPMPDPKLFKKEYNSLPEEFKQDYENWTLEEWNLHFALFTYKRRNIYNFGKLRDYKFASQKDLDVYIDSLKEHFGNQNEAAQVNIDEKLTGNEKDDNQRIAKHIEGIRNALKNKLIFNEQENKEELEKIARENTAESNKTKYELSQEILASMEKEKNIEGATNLDEITRLSEEVKEEESHDQDIQGIESKQSKPEFPLSSSGSSSDASQSSSGSSSEELPGQEMASENTFDDDLEGLENIGYSSGEENAEEGAKAQETDKSAAKYEAKKADLSNKLDVNYKNQEVHGDNKANKSNKAEDYKKRDKYNTGLETQRNPQNKRQLNPEDIGTDPHDIAINNKYQYVPRKPDEADKLLLELARPDKEDTKENDELFGKIDPLVIKELRKEIYIKTGINNIKEGMHVIEEGNFTFNLHDMKKRRRELIRSELATDDYIYHPDPNKKRLKKLFGDLLIKPQLDDLDHNVLGVLELESLQEVLSEVERCRKEKTNPMVFEKNIEEDLENTKEVSEYNEKMVEKMEDARKNLILDDFANRIMLDRVYLNAVLGTKSYLPMHLTLTQEDVNGLSDLIGMCDFSQSPKEWVEIALQRAIDDIFDVRAEVELKLTRAELIAYDRSIEERFKPKNIKKDMLKQLSFESIAAYKTLDIVSDQEREAVTQNKISEYLQEVQAKMNKNMDTRKMDYSKQLYGAWYSRARVGRPKDHNCDYLYEEDMIEKFRNYDAKHEKYSQLPKTKEGFARYWVPKKYVNIRQRADDHERERQEVRQMEHKMNRAAEIACTIENLLKSKRVRDKVGHENVEAVRKIIKDRDNLIY